MVNSEKSYTNAVKDEITILIHQKSLDTYSIAKNLANNKKLIATLENKNYSQFYTSHFVQIPKEYLTFHHIRIHIVDKNGYQRYLSWTKKDLGKYVLNARHDLKELYKHPKSVYGISVGRFSISFKGISPIFNKKGGFLGVIEAITFFNSISNNLKKHNINSAIAIDKRFQKQILYPLSNLFIDGYNIANLNVTPNVIHLLRTNNIEKLTNIKSYHYIPNEQSYFKPGYYVIAIPIKNFKNEKIATYIAFITDRYYLVQKEIILDIFLLLFSTLFLTILYLAIREYKKNLTLIQNLDNEVKKQLGEKTKLLYIDTTTGAYKKTKFDLDRLDHLNSKTVILNIRNFSKLNAYYGFDIGDKILRTCTKRIEKLLQRKIYRLNGDEFLFFSTQPRKEIKEIKKQFSNTPIKIMQKDLSIQIMFSFGVAPTRLEKLISKLSIAVHEAKAHPFSHFMYYREKSLDSNFIKFNALLYEAIYRENNTKIVPYFQGIYDNKQKKIYKYEALARLHHNGEVYSPYYFINVAQSSGFIHEITKVMIEKSFHYLSTQPEEIELSINITEQDLATKQLKEFLLEKLEKYKLSPQRITLEILEGITSNGTKNNIKQLNKLKTIGFQLAIDDFGVEYSNFERLTEIEIDFIKIDGKYIKTLLENEKSLQITKAICNFAHTMGIKVVAEFVENIEIQKIIEDLDIDYSQGYCFSKPSATITYDTK
jgi:diguanylate cyclase (GGDEF)-like protein